MVAPLLVQTAAIGEPDATLERKSYRAHLAAAEKALRLGEGPEGRRWLSGAPAARRGWEWSHLKAALDNSIGVFTLPQSRLSAFVVAPGAVLAAGGDVNGGIYIWKLPDYELLRHLEGHTDAVYSLAFSPDGKQIASVARDVSARAWNVEEGKEIASLTLDNPGVAAVAFAPDGKTIATCSWTGKEQSARVRGVVWIWDAATGRTHKRVLVGVKPLDSITYAPDGESIAVGSWDGIVHVLNTQGDEVHTLRLPEERIYNAVQTVAVSPDSQWVAAGSKDRTARVWRLDSGELVSTLRGHNGYINAITFNPTGDRLATASTDASLRIWDWKQERALSTLHGHDRSVSAVSWRGAHIRSVSRDGTARVWHDGDDLGATRLIDTGVEGTYTATLTPDGQSIAVATFSGRVLFFNASTGTKEAEWVAHEDSTCNTLALSADGEFLVTCSWDKTGRVWNRKTRELIRTFDAGVGLADCDISPDGKIVLLPAGNEIQLWDVSTGRQAAVLRGHEGSVRSARFHPDGLQIISAGADRTLRLWDVANASQKAASRDLGYAVSRVAYSRDGARVAFADDSGAVRVMGGALTGEIHTVYEGDVGITNLAFSPDGNRLAVADDGLRILDPEETGSLLHIKPHRDTVWHLSFSPDGRRIASCSTNGTIAVSETVPAGGRSASSPTRP